MQWIARQLKICGTSSSPCMNLRACQGGSYSKKMNACRIAQRESVSSYIGKVKEIRDQLHDAGDKISNEKMVPIIFNGFSNDYEMFVSSVASRETIPSFENLYGIFQFEEMWMESEDVALWLKTKKSSQKW